MYVYIYFIVLDRESYELSIYRLTKTNVLKKNTDVIKIRIPAFLIGKPTTKE